MNSLQHNSLLKHVMWSGLIIVIWHSINQNLLLTGLSVPLSYFTYPICLFCVCLSAFVFFFFGLFRAAPSAYGGSKFRGLIGATAAGLCHSHSNARSELCLWPIPQLTATLDPQLTERGQGSNRNLMVPSHICFCCATMGTPLICLLSLVYFILSIPINVC